MQTGASGGARFTYRPEPEHEPGSLSFRAGALYAGGRSRPPARPEHRHIKNAAGSGQKEREIRYADQHHRHYSLLVCSCSATLPCPGFPESCDNPVVGRVCCKSACATGGLMAGLIGWRRA